MGTNNSIEEMNLTGGCEGKISVARMLERNSIVDRRNHARGLQPDFLVVPTATMATSTAEIKKMTEIAQHLRQE